MAALPLSKPFGCSVSGAVCVRAHDFTSFLAMKAAVCIRAALAILECKGAVIGNLREAAEHLAPERALIAVVSDHGAVMTDTQLNSYPAFRDVKLFMIDERVKVADSRVWLG
jgi:hypothetical protein